MMRSLGPESGMDRVGFRAAILRRVAGWSLRREHGLIGPQLLAAPLRRSPG